MNFVNTPVDQNGHKFCDSK